MPAPGPYTPAVTLLCVSIMADDAEAALRLATLARDRGADMIEFRLDHLLPDDPTDEQFGDITRLISACPLPCIATCRPLHEGGDFEGPDAVRLDLFRRLATAEHPPRWIDLELSTLERDAELARQLLGIFTPEAAAGDSELTSSLVVSTHDFKSRPADLYQRLERMRRFEPAKTNKIAWMARSVRDNLDLFELLSERDRPTIALAMGEAGILSRVLAPKFGGFLTFASLEPTAVTAPGQPTLDELLNLYNIRAITRATCVYGVVGWPVEQSKSPLLHNCAFNQPHPSDHTARAHDGVYLPLPVAPGWESFKATLGALVDHPTLDFRGASVTIPHKEHLLRLAQERECEGWITDPLAARIGAANTLARRDDGSWLITNTDAPAITVCLRRTMGDGLQGRRIAIIGAGGVARAAACAVSDAGATAVIYNRTQQRAEMLAAELKGAGKIVAAPWNKLHQSCAEAYINCTPIGMRGGPAPDKTPLDLDTLEDCQPQTVIFDTVYNPTETPLLQAARARNLPTIDGVDMFIHQAAAQSELWTQRPAPVELFERLMRDVV
ncbi:MAG: type I 3-dehydroquinate dehydratase [Phycisphaeraceae bacterium]|nr:MAG: type I 3-dehydroquinate dehydratase [Phycisphaeraceae bacterium]